MGTVCNELARDCDLTVVLEESSLPLRPAVAAACELLGIDPLYVANEGKFVAVVAPDEADAALSALRGHPLGAMPSGSARSAPSLPASSCSTTFGGTRIVDMLVGDPLPASADAGGGGGRCSGASLTSRRRLGKYDQIGRITLLFADPPQHRSLEDTPT